MTIRKKRTMCKCTRAIVITILSFYYYIYVLDGFIRINIFHFIIFSFIDIGKSFIHSLWENRKLSS